MKTIVMVVVVVVVVVTDAASNSWQNNTERSIVYVKGFPAAGGDLIIAPDTSVAPEDAFAIFNTTRRCACRVACFSIAACQMVAAVSREDTGKEWIECRLIAVRYLSTMPHLQDDRAAVLFLWPTERHVWVDLHYYPDEEELKWGDGTLFNVNYNYSTSFYYEEIVYFFASNHLNGVPRKINMTLEVICQANPLGEPDW
ncbi:uncharacterized protein LOC135089502 isoform X2 [Scylla paramamosain]|uniref:uncharacterized protein LOC135089502 isoform X2 n=1 Tax=Scylla paramamosain TaxID=85552 RepID=UPI003082F25D